MRHMAIVIRADGTVPFDADVHPDHKAAMLGHLATLGHTVHTLPDGTVKLVDFTRERHAELEAAHHARLAEQAAKAED